MWVEDVILAYHSWRITSFLTQLLIWFLKFKQRSHILYFFGTCIQRSILCFCKQSCSIIQYNVESNSSSGGRDPNHVVANFEKYLMEPSWVTVAYVGNAWAWVVHVKISSISSWWFFHRSIFVGRIYTLKWKWWNLVTCFECYYITISQSIMDKTQILVHMTFNISIKRLYS